jgi:hypothetical protein
VQHFILPENDVVTVVFIVSIRFVCVRYVTFGITADGNTARKQRIQRQHPSATVPQDLGVTVTVYKQMRHQCFSKDEARHFGVRRVMKQEKKRVGHHPLLAAIRLVLVKMQRQTCDCFS